MNQDKLGKMGRRVQVSHVKKKNKIYIYIYIYIVKLKN